MHYRIGIGYDIHRLASGRKLFLGGVEIKFPQGLKAHSDGDVIIHAVCDALLGAAGLGDIGIHFPDSDPKYKGISSVKLLDSVALKLRGLGYRPVNADCVLIADKPKIGPYRLRMSKVLSKILMISPGAVNIKATTNEGIGPLGSKALAAYAVVLLERE